MAKVFLNSGKMTNCPNCGTPIMTKKYKGESQTHILERADPGLLKGILNVWRYHCCSKSGEINNKHRKVEVR